MNDKPISDEENFKEAFITYIQMSRSIPIHEAERVVTDFVNALIIIKGMKGN